MLTTGRVLSGAKVDSNADHRVQQVHGVEEMLGTGVAPRPARAVCDHPHDWRHLVSARSVRHVTARGSSPWPSSSANFLIGSATPCRIPPPASPRRPRSTHARTHARTLSTHQAQPEFKPWINPDQNDLPFYASEGSGACVAKGKTGVGNRLGLGDLSNASPLKSPLKRPAGNTLLSPRPKLTNARRYSIEYRV